MQSDSSSREELSGASDQETPDPRSSRLTFILRRMNGRSPDLTETAAKLKLVGQFKTMIIYSTAPFGHHVLRSSWNVRFDAS